MAKTTNVKTSSYHDRKKHKRPGVHSKNRHSNNKNSKMYEKKYRGQGK